MVTYHQWEHHKETLVAKYILDRAVVKLWKIEDTVGLACFVSSNKTALPIFVSND